MADHGSDKVFGGSIPEIYDTYLVPLIFEAYAADLTTRVLAARPADVLEIAAGTGAVTRAMTAALPAGTTVIATDLNQAMLERAAARGTARPVTWRQADATKLPFPDGSFDAVVCQFGVMFFPDKPAAHAEVRRVLRRGGLFAFNVWDRIEDNEFADVVTTAVAAMFPADPPRFLARTPHGYHDVETIARDAAAGGFSNRPSIATVTARSRAASYEHPAIAFCQGTPLRNEIEARDAARVHEATVIAAEALARRFGRTNIDGKIQAHVATVTK